MTSDLKARLDAMVGAEIKRQLEGCEDRFAGPHLTNALRSIGLSEMARADAAEAKVEALAAELEEADKGLLFWRGIPAYTLDMTYDEAMSSKAVEAALARQKARAALKLGGE